MTGSFLILLSILSAMGGFLFGYDTGVISGAMILIRRDYRLTPVWHEVIVSGTIAAAAVFSIIGGLISGLIGRKFIILLSSLIFTIGSAVMSAAHNKEVLLFGRLIVGSAIGLSSMIIPTYIAECSPVDIRGRLTVLNQFMITFGLFVSTLVGGAFSNVEEGWRYMLGLAAVPCVFQLVAFVFMPESPRYLIARNRYEEAEKVLRRIRGPTYQHEEYEELIRTVTALGQGQNCLLTLTKIFQNSVVRRAFLVGSSLHFFQQMVGINTVMYYGASILKMAGFTSDSMAIWLSAGVAGVNCLFTVVGFVLIERVGRRKLLLGSLTCVFVSLVVLGSGFLLMNMRSPSVVSSLNSTQPCDRYRTCHECIADYNCGFCYDPDTTINSTCLPSSPDESLYSYPPAHSQCNATDGIRQNHWVTDYCPSSYSWILLIGMLLYLASFAPGMGPLPWTINAEIYPYWARSTANSVTTTINWSANLLISMSFLSLMEAITQYGAFYLYALFALCALVVFYFIVPETGGTSMENVNQTFGYEFAPDVKSYYVSYKDVDEVSEDIVITSPQ